MKRKMIFDTASKLRETNYALLIEIAEKFEWVAEEASMAVVEELYEVLR